jgi:hypothetical protein
MRHHLTTDILTTELIDRLWSHIAVRDDGDCWEWDASRTPSGYGRITIRISTGVYRVEYAHRLVLVHATGEPIPAGMLAMHSCDNPPCCNPSHIHRGTYADNAQDRENKGRGWRRPNHAKTTRQPTERRLRPIDISSDEHADAMYRLGVGLLGDLLAGGPGRFLIDERG